MLPASACNRITCYLLTDTNRTFARRPLGSGEPSLMIRATLGDRHLPIKVRCQSCSELGRLQVRPPVPMRGPGGWMELH